MSDLRELFEEEATSTLSTKLPHVSQPGHLPAHFAETYPHC